MTKLQSKCLIATRARYTARLTSRPNYTRLLKIDVGLKEKKKT